MSELEIREAKRLDAIKAFWLSKSPEERTRIMKERGKKGGTKRWFLLTPKERISVIVKMNKAKIAKKVELERLKINYGK